MGITFIINYGTLGMISLIVRVLWWIHTADKIEFMVPYKYNNYWEKYQPLDDV